MKGLCGISPVAFLGWLHRRRDIWPGFTNSGVYDSHGSLRPAMDWAENLPGPVLILKKGMCVRVRCRRLDGHAATCLSILCM